MKHHESQSRTNESQLRKQRVLQWKCLDLNITKQLIWHQNAVLQFTEIKIYFFYCKPQERLKEICVVKQKPREQLHKSQEQCILQKRHLMVNRSLLASYAEAYELFSFLGDFYGSGTQDTEVSKSLHGDYGIEGKFASEWRDWRTLKGTLVQDLIEKRNVEKTLFFIYRNNNSQTTPRPPVIRKPTILGQVYRDSSGHENHCPCWAKRGLMRRRTLTGCWLTARRAVALRLKTHIQIVLLGPNWENALKIPVGCCQTASWAACALSATTEWGEIMIWLFIIILTVH